MAETSSPLFDALKERELKHLQYHWQLEIYDSIFGDGAFTNAARGEAESIFECDACNYTRPQLRPTQLICQRHWDMWETRGPGTGPNYDNYIRIKTLQNTYPFTGIEKSTLMTADEYDKLYRENLAALSVTPIEDYTGYIPCIEAISKRFIA